MQALAVALMPRALAQRVVVLMPRALLPLAFVPRALGLQPGPCFVCTLPRATGARTYCMTAR